MKESKMMNVFNKYVKKFNISKGNVKETYFHSIKMMDLCKEIASNLGIFTEEEIIICGFIGLFHDIGSFSNKDKYVFFLNETIDNTKKTVDIIFDSDKLIRNITEDKKYDDIIKVSIYCHNKVGLPNGLDDKILHFCKVLKDAHALDNFRMAINYPYLDMHIDNYPNNMVYDSFKKYNVINSKVSDNDADCILQVLSLVFGVNYLYTYKIFEKEAYIDKLISSLIIKNKEIKKFFTQIGAVLNLYIDKKIAS
ncbi:MAG: HD domain-containing protein [Bacilli bacterium]|nr:HD domain-containing protein [Bacilli bacterium]